MTHEMISRTKTEFWHRLLTHHPPLYFPEARTFKGNARSDWFLAFLELFPIPGSIPRSRSRPSSKQPGTLSD